jgi:hypothetical protein
MPTFSPVALTIDVEEGDKKTAAQALWALNTADIHSSRVIFHEAVHYWQQISQGFLLRLAEEDWQRMTELERGGPPSGNDPIRREFYRKEPKLGFSASDLQECLARFWEVIAFGPNNIMRDEWKHGRLSVHPDYVNANRSKHFFRRPGRLAWGYDEFLSAMTMIGGQYAGPFLATGYKMGNGDIFVFPWLAHYALQTRRPAEVFASFLESVATDLVIEANQLMNRHSAEPSDAFEATMVKLGLPALLACAPIAEREGERILTAVASYWESPRKTSPLIAWTFESRIMPVVKLLTASQAVSTFTKQF